MKTNRVTLLVFGLCFITACNAYAQRMPLTGSRSLSTDNPMHSLLDSLIDQRVSNYFQDKQATGLSLGILIKGQTFFYNYGRSRQENDPLPTKATVYEIGSMTKTFTGILLAQAVLDKKIDLDDDIRKYLKGDYPNLTYQGTPIRIRNLANHTSRITRIFPNLWERTSYREDNPFSNYTRRLLYEGLHQMKMDTLPGRIYSYSNMGVALLGCMLEDVYKQQYFDLVSKYILRPLNMTGTRIDLSAIPASQIAYPHDRNGEVTSFWDVRELPALGALRSNTTDMVRYIAANNTNQLSSIKLAHQPTFGNKQEGMGLNWFIHTTADGYQVFEHSGGTGGSRSSLQCLPQLNSGFVILSNSLANRNELEKELLAVLLKLVKAPPEAAL